MSKFTLSKNERLKSKKSIDRLFEEGKFIGRFPVKMAYIVQELPEGEKPSLFSVSVPKKNFKRAVDRNRIKRLFREAYRLNCLSLKEQLLDKDKQLMLMFVYQGKEMPKLSDIEKSVVAIIDKLKI